MEEEIKTPPHSAEAERSVLGSILLDADAGDNLRVLDLCLTHGLEPDSFYDPRNRILFETLLEMSQATMPVDAMTQASSSRWAPRSREIALPVPWPK